jgi:hypothetical protein
MGEILVNTHCPPGGAFRGIGRSPKLGAVGFNTSAASVLDAWSVLDALPTVVGVAVISYAVAEIAAKPGAVGGGFSSRTDAKATGISGSTGGGDAAKSLPPVIVIAFVQLQVHVLYRVLVCRSRASFGLIVGFLWSQLHGHGFCFLEVYTTLNVA